MGLSVPAWARCPPLPLVSVGAEEEPPVPSASLQLARFLLFLLRLHLPTFRRGPGHLVLYFMAVKCRSCLLSDFPPTLPSQACAGGGCFARSRAGSPAAPRWSGDQWLLAPSSWPRPTRTPTAGCTVAGTVGITLPMASRMGRPGTHSAKVRAGQVSITHSKVLS